MSKYTLEVTSYYATDFDSDEIAIEKLDTLLYHLIAEHIKLFSEDGRIIFDTSEYY